MPRKILLTLFIFALFLFLYFVSALYCFFHVPLIAKNSETAIKVYPNQNLQQLSERLVQQHIIRHPGFFEWVVEISGNVGHLRYGEYQIRYPLTAWQLLNNLKSGTGLVVHRLTIVNGWTFHNIRQATMMSLLVNRICMDFSLNSRCSF